MYDGTRAITSMDERTDGGMDAWMDARMDGLTEARMEVNRVDGRTHGGMDGRTDGWMDGRTSCESLFLDGVVWRTVGLMDGRTRQDRRTSCQRTRGYSSSCSSSSSSSYYYYYYYAYERRAPCRSPWPSAAPTSPWAPVQSGAGRRSRGPPRGQTWLPHAHLNVCNSAAALSYDQYPQTKDI